MRNFAGNSRSEKPKSFGRGRGSDSRNSSMHKATCDSCGKNCEVPFKPTSGKPIYCSSCFDKNPNESSNKYGRERSENKFRGGDSRKRNYDDRSSETFNVVCDKCGKDCEVPFRPTKGKPVYCDNCFGNNNEKENDFLKKEIAVMNKKLDEILEVLASVPSLKNYQVELEENVTEPNLERKTKKKLVLKNKEK